jgi:peptidoglycan hydrolase-like protein with peptidoglycan-binding domain
MLRFTMAALALGAGLAAAGAQVPQPAPPPDPALQRAQAAFEALPDTERRQIQLDLGFAAGFSGAAQGGFGPLTYRAIQAFERQNRSAVDGVLEVPERAALAAAARKERERLGFRQAADQVSKASIGLPMALLPRAEPNAPGGPRWQTADGKATVALRAPASAEGTLEQLYEKALQSSNPQRKVTYKLLRPDFFVVAGETPQGKFFQRMARLPDSSLRGFTISYDKTLSPEWDRLTVAAANTFFPAGAPAPAAVAAPARPAAPAPDPVAGRTFERSLTAVVVAPGRALTAAAAFKACSQPRAGAQPVRLIGEDAASGLAMVGFESGAPALASAIQSGGEGARILAYGAGPDGARTLLALPGDVAGASLSAPLQPGAAGAPVFGAGGLAGIVVSDPSARLQVAGVVLASRHRIADAAAVERFLKVQGVTMQAGQPAAGAQPSPSGLGDITARHSRSVVTISCGG